MAQTYNVKRLRTFVTQFAQLIDSGPDEQDILSRGKDLLSALVTTDDWLPAEFAQPSAERYQQYLLHTDSQERFSVVSFVWGPGQTTPIHNHTVWGLIGMLRGAEESLNYERLENGAIRRIGEPVYLKPGEVESVSPTVGDIHKVSNALSDKVSVSIHVYGANIGAVKRSVLYEDGSSKQFISGYTNTVLPNIWDQSKESE